MSRNAFMWATKDKFTDGMATGYNAVVWAAGFVTGFVFMPVLWLAAVWRD